MWSSAVYDMYDQLTIIMYLKYELYLLGRLFLAN